MLAAGMLEGLPPNNAAYQMRLRCPADTALGIVDAIVETFDPADTAAAAFEEVPNQPGWVVEAYFGLPPDEARIRALIGFVAGEAAAGAAEFARIEAGDWVKRGLEGLPPVRSGRFLVHGAHDRARRRPNEIDIEIEAALAFGTGQHGSTRGCLSFLERIAKRRRPQSILDVGTGTGVLAIAAALLFRVPVRAGDIDPVAVATASANAQRNRAGPFVRAVQAHGIDHPLLAGARYDLAIANILAGPLRKLAPALARALAPGGEIILSGLLPQDVPGVASAYRAQKIVMNGRIDIEGWATLLMRRPFRP